MSLSPVRRLAAALAFGALLSVTACGLDVQTMKPYTPAEGVQVDVTPAADPQAAVKIRNLLIVAPEPGEGFLSGSMTTRGKDALTGVSGVAIKGDGAAGAPLVVELDRPIAVADGALVVLTSGPFITVKSADLAPGRTAALTLQFQNAGEISLQTTVVDGKEGQWASVTPTPTPSGQSSASESETPTPTPSASASS